MIFYFTWWTECFIIILRVVPPLLWQVRFREPPNLPLSKENRKGGKMESIIASVVTGILALIGIIITNVMSNKEIEHKLEVNQAVTNTKLDNLTQEVKSHNTQVQQIPVLMEKVKSLEIKVQQIQESSAT